MPKLKNFRQEKFCRLYTSEDKGMFGNGSQAYCEAYEKNPATKAEWASVRAVSSRLLTNANIYGRINELLDEHGWNDQNADKQGLFMLNQFADLKVKLGAFKEYNQLKRRVAQPQTTINLLSFEQHIHINTNRAREVRPAFSGSQAELSDVQRVLPENQNEGILFNPLQAEPRTALLGVQDQGAGEDWEADTALYS